MSSHPPNETTAPNAPYAAIVANPYSGSAGHTARVTVLADALRRRGLHAVVIWDLDGLARLAGAPGFGEHCRCVIAAGGDGTLNCVVNHRLGDVPVAHYPLGNENLFARHFGYTGEPEPFAAAVAAGRTRAIDLGRVNGRRFTIVTSAGFDGAAAHRLHAIRAAGGAAQRVNRLSYLRPILGTAIRYTSPMMRLSVDDEPALDAALVMVFNLPQYGLGLANLCRDAEPTSGRLNYVAFQRPGRLALLRYAAATALGGRHVRLKDVHTGAARHLRIDADQPVPMETDGEAAAATPADIAVEPAALSIIVP